MAGRGLSGQVQRGHGVTRIQAAVLVVMAVCRRVVLGILRAACLVFWHGGDLGPLALLDITAPSSRLLSHGGHLMLPAGRFGAVAVDGLVSLFPFVPLSLLPDEVVHSSRN
jgi:hypothetical protein